ncbi:unnamed protein product [Candida verbasci]|uniref:Anaphase-promoting complex subunit 13 n=1 Tax=Candida verbasci TaxID=1227364 RepID=A0A9W4XEB7_9ASCO|nr:unnamed protein product [Candida verbasci]
MSKDGIYSYVQFDDPSKVIYMENWINEPIPFNDIDTTNLIEKTGELFANDDEEDEINLNSLQFGSKTYKNRKSKNKKWMDLNIEHFLKDSERDKKLIDETLLPGLTNVSEFLTDGQDQIDDHLILQSPELNHDFSINSTSDLINHASNTFLNLRSHSNQQQQSNQSQNSQVFQTPRPGRVRQVSSDKFQTPIARIMR